ncbi:MAG: SUMF1/EgtB/PvdO family nonheme iron enzyme [Planctomycetes bacterium]|nr:SUMF1/EgtB/PvdO family nonheme iron enzyme [Planctomycetota bacterium]
MALKLFTRKKPKAHAAARPELAPTSKKFPDYDHSGPPDFVPAQRQPLDEDPLKRLYQQGRFCTILMQADQWGTHAGADLILKQASRKLEQTMALVPAGNVTIPQTLTAQPGEPEEDLDVEPFLLDVHAVTNARYQQFVDGDGYDDLDFWPEELWPHLIEFKDLTGRPGPRYWREGRHDAPLADHPIVGISWYEARAFALWIGQRLQTEREWQMAASWHINSAADLLRRFPWGDAMDNARCNIWSSRMGTTVPVSNYPKGAAPNHVLQLVGNVWEWTDTEFQTTDEAGHQIIAEMPMQVIRGGAFDTYFEIQATSQFRTGQISLARPHNLGFRCAMNLTDAGWLD